MILLPALFVAVRIDHLDLTDGAPVPRGLVRDVHHRLGQQVGAVVLQLPGGDPSGGQAEAGVLREGSAENREMESTFVSEGLYSFFSHKMGLKYCEEFCLIFLPITLDPAPRL